MQYIFTDEFLLYSWVAFAGIGAFVVLVGLTRIFAGIKDEYFPFVPALLLMTPFSMAIVPAVFLLAHLAVIVGPFVGVCWVVGKAIKRWRVRGES